DRPGPRPGTADQSPRPGAHRHPVGRTPVPARTREPGAADRRRGPAREGARPAIRVGSDGPRVRRAGSDVRIPTRGRGGSVGFGVGGFARKETTVTESPAPNPDTIPALLAARVEAAPDTVACYHRGPNGAWVPSTWRELADEVRRTAA